MKKFLKGATFAAKAIGVAVGGGLVAAGTKDGLDATALVALPPLAKLLISVATPLIVAWLKKSPTQPK
jgi:hypothetical protein